MALPSRLRVVSRISIRLSCVTGDVCDEVEVNIKGCVQGKDNKEFMVDSVQIATQKIGHFVLAYVLAYILPITGFN